MTGRTYEVFSGTGVRSPDYWADQRDMNRKVEGLVKKEASSVNELAPIIFEVTCTGLGTYGVNTCLSPVWCPLYSCTLVRIAAYFGVSPADTSTPVLNILRNDISVVAMSVVNGARYTSMILDETIGFTGMQDQLKFWITGSYDFKDPAVSAFFQMSPVSENAKQYLPNLGAGMSFRPGS
jgi:hypothetical protein